VIARRKQISRRGILGAGGIAAGSVVLAACGALGGGAAKGDVAPAAQIKSGSSVRYHTYVADPQVKTEVDKLWAMRHPDVKLEYTVSPAGEILTKLTAELAGGTPPEVAMTGYRDVPQLQPQLVNLGPYMRRDRFPTEAFLDRSLEQYRYGGNSFALPHTFPVRVGVYNASLLTSRGVPLPPAQWDAPGWTWDKLQETARALTRTGDQPDTSVWGWGWDTKAALPNTTWVMLFCNNNGGAFLREDGKECLLTQPRSQEALQFMQDLIQRSRVARTPEDAKVTPVDIFQVGRLGLGFFPPAEMGNYRKQITFDWGLGPVPLGPGGAKRSSIMTGSAWMMMEAAPNREAGWGLLQTVTSPEYQRAAGSIVGYMPPRKAVLAEYAGQEPPKSSKILLEAAENVYLFPKTPWSNEAEAVLTPLLNDLWAGKRSASEVAQESKRLIDPIVQKPFSFKTK
jgi:multiple sugar transport system substrate-binding protein